MRGTSALAAALAAAALLAPAPANAATQLVIQFNLRYDLTCRQVDGSLSCEAVLTRHSCVEHAGVLCTVEPFTLPLVGVPSTTACVVLLPDDTREAEPLVVHTSRAGDLVLDVTMVRTSAASALTGVSRLGEEGVATVATVGLGPDFTAQTCARVDGVLQGELTYVAP